MKQVYKLLSKINSLEINLFLEGSDLKYRNYKNNLTPEILSEIKAEKENLITYFKNINNFSKIEKQKNLSQYIPLSLTQQSLWFFEQLLPNIGLYNIPLILKLSGDLNKDALIKSLNTIIKRHEILRTKIVTIDGSAYQKVLDNAFSLKIEKLEGKSLSNKLKEEITRAFDFNNEVLFRGLLLELNNKEYVLVLTFHHVVADGWSNGIFIRELIACYESYSNNQLPSLPELLIQYKDYSVWQRKWLQGKVLDKQLIYWKKKLFEVSTLVLPSKPRPKDQSYNGKHYLQHLPKEILVRLSKLAKEKNVTLFILLLAMFKGTLSRICNQRDIAIGTPVANRRTSEAGQLLGCFVNTLVLRTDCSNNPTFEELIRKVKMVALEAYEHQDIPFDELAKHLDMVRNLSMQPLFQVMFTLQNAEKMNTRMGDLELDYMVIDNELSMFDLVITAEETEKGLYIEYEYATDLFDEEHIKRLHNYYIRFIEYILDNPKAYLSEIPILDQTELTQISKLNDTEYKYPKDKTVYELFEKNTNLIPDAIAVVYKDHYYSYSCLYQKINKFSSYLLNNKAKLGDLILVYSERSIDLLISMLSIFKIGAVYIPLNTDSSLSHNLSRIKQVNANHILLPVKYKNELLEYIKSNNTNLNILELDTNLGYASDKHIEVNASNIAYIIHTSGSTGIPKGVMISHQGMINHIYAKIKDLTLNKNSAIIQNASQIFDISIWQFLTALVCQGTTHILNNEESKDPYNLFHYTIKNKCTILEIVPSFLMAVLENKEKLNLRSLEYLILTGEAFYSDLYKMWARINNSVKVVNAYGPTECSDDVTHYIVNSTAQHNNATIPIGYAINNTKIYILDKYFNVLPIGSIGDIYIGGDGVGYGYINEPAKTGLVFVPNPFDNGTRLYKTGDLGRYLSDGNIEFLGRIDHQVKIRGFRIELGEIESVLNRHPFVHQSVILTNIGNDKQQDKLICYYVESNFITNNIGKKDELFYERISNWRDVWDNKYKEGHTNNNSLMNFSGWISSYTNKQFSLEESLEAISNTVEKILSLSPKNILEIGCGSGLLLHKLAPHCKEYVAIDTSRVALDLIQNQIEKNEIKNIKLFCKSANEIDCFSEFKFDIVIINNVVQYFPGIDYLTEVLDKSIKLVKDNGVIFIGDVYNYQWLRTFHASVQLFQARVDLTLSELQKKINNKTQNEKQLFIDIDYFIKFAHDHDISYLETELKRGKYNNEMVRFRYDIVLYKNNSYKKVWNGNINTFDWTRDAFSLNKIEKLLDEQHEVICINNVPNARLLDDTINENAIFDDNNTHLIVKQIKENKSYELLSKAIDPESIRSLVKNTNYSVQIGVPLSHKKDSYDAYIIRDDVYKKYYIGLKLSDIPRTLSNNPAIHEDTFSINKVLREYLQLHLPDYMVPTVFIRLDEIPLTPNGKIDRKALPVPEGREGLDEYEEPIGLLENQLADVWKEVLKISDKVGRNDNFFNLGGHSLLATQLISRIRTNLKSEVPLKAIFEHSTLKDLAKAIEKEFFAQGLLPPIHVISREELIPLSLSQQGLLLLERLSPNLGLYNTQTILRLTGELNKKALIKSLQRIVERHEILRTKIVIIGDACYQEVSDVDNFNLRIKKIEKLEEDLQEKIIEETTKPFNFNNEILFRGLLLESNNKESVLILTFHDSVADGWSKGIFNRELTICYEKYLNDQIPILPELPIQYKDYSMWQRKWLQGEILDVQLAYWKKQLFKAPILSLPGKQRPEKKSYNGRYFEQYLSKEIFCQLNQLAKEKNVTLFVVLLAAFKGMLSRVCNQSDIVIGTYVANRRISETEQLLGSFINTLAIRTDCGNSQIFEKLVERVEKTLLEAYEHQDVPFEQLIDYLNLPRNLGAQPLTQVIFALHNMEIEDIRLNNLKLSHVVKSNTLLRFDLVLNVAETEDGLYLGYEYATDLFDEEHIKKLGGYYEKFIKCILTNKNMRVSDYVWS